MFTSCLLAPFCLSLVPKTILLILIKLHRNLILSCTWWGKFVFPICGSFWGTFEMAPHFNYNLLVILLLSITKRTLFRRDFWSRDLLFFFVFYLCCWFILCLLLCLSSIFLCCLCFKFWCVNTKDEKYANLKIPGMVLEWVQLCVIKTFCGIGSFGTIGVHCV